MKHLPWPFPARVDLGASLWAPAGGLRSGLLLMFWMFSLDRLILFGMAGRACGAWRTLLIGRASWNRAPHQEGRHIRVHALDHGLEQLVRFKLVNQQRILLLEARQLNV